MKYLIPILLLSLVCTTGFAQSTPELSKGPALKPTMAAKAAAIKYPDSTAFNAEFKELYPLIKPTPSVLERTDRTFDMMARVFKNRGVDSVKAYEAVMKTIDKSMDEKILFEVYRKDFTAEELKSLVAFFKTPVGKHYLEVEGPLLMARGQEIDGYVHRQINTAIMPMVKPLEPGERAARNVPPGHPGAPAMSAPPAQSPSNPH